MALKPSISSGSLLQLFILGLLGREISAVDSGLECPVSMPEDLSPCTFDSRFDPSLSCDYESTYCCPSGGCAEVKCQCILSVFACVVSPLQCQELCPETKPDSTVSCDLGIGIDCLYGDPVFCESQEEFFSHVESVCYCFNETFSCKDYACIADSPTATPSGLTACPASDPWRNVSTACDFDEGTTCKYGEFCCDSDSVDCVADTVCMCRDNIFDCVQPPLACPSRCPEDEPVSEACNQNPRFVCEYDLGMCEGGDATTAARGCSCNIFDQTFICFDICNSTVIDTRTPSSSTSTPSDSPLQEPSTSQLPSEVDTIPSPTPSDLPSKRPTSDLLPAPTSLPSTAAPNESDPVNPSGCPDDAFISVSCLLDSSTICQYPRFRCTPEVISPALCSCDNQAFVCIFEDERCSSISSPVSPSTAPEELIPSPSSAAFLKALSFVARLFVLILPMVY